MLVTLIITGDGRGNREVAFRKPGEYVIGRVETVACQVEDGRVSKQHCALIIKAMDVRIKDLGSANGTKVDGVVLGGESEAKGASLEEKTAEMAVPRSNKKEAAVHDGSRIEIGTTTIRVAIQLDPMEREKIGRWVGQAEQKMQEVVEILGHVLDLDPENNRARALRDEAERFLGHTDKAPS